MTRNLRLARFFRSPGRSIHHRTGTSCYSTFRWNLENGDYYEFI